MPIRGSPNGARHPRPQAGRDRPEWVVAINRNGWSSSIGMSGRDQSESLVAISRCAQAMVPLGYVSRDKKLFIQEQELRASGGGPRAIF